MEKTKPWTNQSSEWPRKPVWQDLRWHPRRKKTPSEQILSSLDSSARHLHSRHRLEKWLLKLEWETTESGEGSKNLLLVFLGPECPKSRIPAILRYPTARRLNVPAISLVACFSHFDDPLSKISDNFVKFPRPSKKIVLFFSDLRATEASTSLQMSLDMKSFLFSRRQTINQTN